MLNDAEEKREVYRERIRNVTETLAETEGKRLAVRNHRETTTFRRVGVPASMGCRLPREDSWKHESVKIRVDAQTRLSKTCRRAYVNHL